VRVFRRGELDRGWYVVDIVEREWMAAFPQPTLVVRPSRFEPAP
jgi:hypothetical protein